MLLDSRLLQKYIEHFYGYGELTADFWYIGMEEAGGETEDEIVQRVIRWDELGQGTVVDNADLHEAVQDKRGISLSYLFKQPVKIQRTWAKLIRIYIATKGQCNVSVEAVRNCQSSFWGRRGSNTCLLELMPLPSPNVKMWNYGDWSNLPELSTRAEYQLQLTDCRLEKLRGLIHEHKPRCVVFYSVGRKYLSHWSDIAGVDIGTIEPESVCTGKKGTQFTAKFVLSGETLYSVVSHPSTWGITNKYYTTVGNIIRERMIASKALCSAFPSE